LVLYGGSGVGKTHLLQAIASYLQTYDPRMAIHYTTIEAFTSAFVAALQRKELDSFKETHRHTDVLLIDDLQFLAGKERTAEELLHTLEVLSSSGAQIVITADRHPSRIPTIDERLRDRLQAGLMIELEPPDTPTRKAILLKLASESGRVIADAVIDRIVAQVPPNVRILEGTFVRMLAFASLTGTEITLEVMERVIDSMPDTSKLSAPSRTPINIARILHETTAALGVDSADICSPKRRRRVVYARQIAMYLSRELTSLSLPTIAQHFGGRDHTTVLYAHRKIQRELLVDEGCRSLVTSLTETLGSVPQASPQDSN
jgi:chromosomal replication initiator protein